MLAALALAAAAGAIAAFAPANRAGRPALIAAALALAVEFVAASLSGNAYLHYYLPAVVPIAVLAAAAGAAVAGPSEPANAPRPRARLRRSLAWLAVVPVAALGAFLWNARRVPSESAVRASSAAAYLDGATSPGATVWVWGAEASVHVLADRPPPRPYFYAYPLLRVGYGPYRDAAGFVAGLERDPPVRIVDTSATNALVPPLDRRARAAWRSPDPGYDDADLDPLFEFVERGYRPEALLGRPGPWVVWVRAAP